jgi:hypothetical protein
LNRFLTAILSCLMLASAAIAQGQSRTKVTPGTPLVVWDRQSRLQDEYAVAGVPAARANPGKDSTWWDRYYFGEVTIPASTAPGVYPVKSGDVTVSVEVVAKPVRKGVAVLEPGATVADAAARLAGGYDLLLKPGVYFWARPIYYGKAEDAPVIVPAGATITGPGAYIRPDPAYPTPPPGDEYTRAAFVGLNNSAANVTIDSVAFDLPEGWRAVQATTMPNLTVDRCRFLSASLVQPGPGLYAEKCEFSGPGAELFVGADGGFVRRCKFIDTSRSHPFVCFGADRNLAMVDNLFIRTDRGPVFQLVWGDVRGCLFLGTQIFDISWSENGCESHLSEPGATSNTFSDNLILHYRIRGSGSAAQWDSRASNNLVKDAAVDGGPGFVIWGENTGNVFEEFELRNGAGIMVGPSATGNVFRRGGVVNWQPGRWNEMFAVPGWYARTSVVVESAPDTPSAGNSMEDVYFTLSPAVKPVEAGNFKMTRCQLNGAAIDAGGPVK